MRLESIIKDSGVIEIMGNPDIEIRSISNDSRKIGPGDLFIAVKGHDIDGHAFIGKAIEAGAAAIVCEEYSQVEESGPVFIKVSSSRHALAIIAANFYDNPSRKLNLVGITGTNGKTTTVTLLYELFMAQGYNCGLLSTIANYVGTRGSEAVNTTSDPITINSLLSEMVDEGCEYCFMEVSSIGVEQERIAGLDFKVAIFSNLTHDHLDYHGTFAEYLRCKKLFFDNLGAGATAIINIDDKHGDVMVQNTRARVQTYSCKGMADHTCRIIEESFEGMLLRIDGREAWTRLIGRHNAHNILAIYSAAMALLSVVIDYAHTPDAMDNVPRTLRELDRGRELICVFGCGGDRDRTKRPEMAKVAEEYSDRIFVTSDNSRTERTEDIMDEIKTGFSPKGLAKTISIADRKEAIRTAIMLAPEGAVILLAGKGHETYQILGKEKHHFDEREIVSEIFRSITNN